MNGLGRQSGLLFVLFCFVLCVRRLRPQAARVSEASTFHVKSFVAPLDEVHVFWSYVSSVNKVAQHFNLESPDPSMSGAKMLL